jgi:UDP-N-acetylglucosamine 1-carboxyvinyltransferase
MKGILQFLGCNVQLQDHTLTIDARVLTGTKVPDEESRQMRSSILMLGPLLARGGSVDVCYPGGCTIGERPVDLHLEALARMGASIHVTQERIQAEAGRLHGCELKLRYPSVGATENILMAAALADGMTCIHGAAREPEIRTLCDGLTAFGVRIWGAGSETITVEGQTRLHDADISIPGDRIVAGTYLGAVLCAGGEVFLREAPDSQMAAVIDRARAMGAEVSLDTAGLRVIRKDALRPVQLATGPYPQFPTDLQPVFMAAAALADGRSEITENVFEARFASAKELQKMGAHIIIDGKRAILDGIRCLHGANVQAGDLRGGAALTAAALAAEGRTEITGYSYIRRGYEDICRDLRGAGAEIRLQIHGVPEDAGQIQG